MPFRRSQRSFVLRSHTTSALLLTACLFGLSLGCGDDPPAKLDNLTAEVGSPCTIDSDECGPDRVCAKELTGGAAYSILVDPLPAPEGYCSSKCAANADCGDQGVCFGRGLLGSGGECRRACQTTADCASGLECATAGELKSPLLPDTCQPLPVPDILKANEAGKRCTQDSECGDGYCDKASGICSGLCITDENCGEGGICIHGVYGARGACHEACQTDSDCQNDQTGWGCGPDKVCVPEADPLPAVGEACSPASAKQDCGEGSCRTEGLSGEKYPGGYCIGSCDEDSDCGALGVCINNVTCLRSCASNDDCRHGYNCQAHPQATGESKQDLVCFPMPARPAQNNITVVVNPGGA